MLVEDADAASVESASAIADEADEDIVIGVIGGRDDGAEEPVIVIMSGVDTLDGDDWDAEEDEDEKVEVVVSVFVFGGTIIV